MEPRFKDTDRHSFYLMPPSLDDWVPEDHLARFVVDIVSRLDLSPIRNSYAGRGSDAYPPCMMAALLFYAYATGVFSSRKIEQATYDSWPSGMLPSTPTLIMTPSPPSAGGS